MTTPHNEAIQRANYKNPKPLDPDSTRKQQKLDVAKGGKAVNSNRDSSEKSIRTLNQ